jgi:hypothetical protein
MSISFPKISREAIAQLYIGAIIASGFGILAGLVLFDGPNLFRHFELPVVIFAVAVIAGEVLPVKLGRGEGEMVPSTTFAFGLLLFGGIGAAALTQAV